MRCTKEQLDQWVQILTKLVPPPKWCRWEYRNEYGHGIFPVIIKNGAVYANKVLGGMVHNTKPELLSHIKFTVSVIQALKGGE